MTLGCRYAEGTLKRINTVLNSKVNKGYELLMS